MNERKSAGERGSAVIEFVMIALFCVPLLLGTATIGLNLIREMEITQVTRDAGRMYSNGIDFTQSGNQDLLVNLAQGLGLSKTGGDAVVIFSTLTYIDAAACEAGGIQNPDTTNCQNLGQTVIIKRVVVGNSDVYTTSFGVPKATFLDSQGNVSANPGYLTDSSAVATGFSTLLSLQPGQYAFMAEMYVRSPGIEFWGALGTPAAYARSIF